MHIRLDFCGGPVCPLPLTPEEAVLAREAGHVVVEVSAQVWEAWEQHLRQQEVFHTLWKTLANLDHLQGG